jgi:hypothetical protein
VLVLKQSGPVPWIAYRRVIAKTLTMWEELQLHFSYSGPLMLRQFFDSDICRVIAAFVLQLLEMFHRSVENLQKVEKAKIKITK